MDPQKLAVFEELLRSRRTALMAKSGQALGELTGERDTSGDASDIASEESDRDLALRMHELDRRLIREIEAALVRVRSGEYGECAACGDDIAERRLMARPTATHCIDCMTELEATRSPRRAFA